MLRLEGISKTFHPGTVNAKLALNGVSLHAKKGDFITIIGANGAGKSTLFNAVAGTFITDAGRILLDGENITVQPSYRRAKQIGRLFQDPLSGTAPSMTIEENLTLAAGNGGWFSTISGKERERFRSSLELLDMGLEDRMNHEVGLLSGGQRQALSLLMATLNPPKLLLLDEHTAALDPKAAEQVLRLTKQIVDEHGLTCLMVTHNMQSALDFGNRLIMMHNGTILFDVAQEERSRMTVQDLHDRFREASGKVLDNDRMILSE